MKQHVKLFATALALAGGLVMNSSAQGISDFQGFGPLNPTYNNWNDPGYQPIYGGSGYAPTFTQTATGYEVNAMGSGSGFYDLTAAGRTVVHADTTANAAVLTLTLNNGNQSNVWYGVKFILNDGLGNSIWYGAYTGQFGVDNNSWASTVGTAVWDATGTHLTMTVPLDPTQLAAAQAGNEYITGFSLVLDPAIAPPGGVYDLTYNSLSLISVPEPSTFALMGLGAAGLVTVRRRMKNN